MTPPSTPQIVHSGPNAPALDPTGGQPAGGPQNANQPPDLDGIRARVEAATEGPWFAFSDNDGGWSNEILVATKGDCVSDASKAAICAECAEPNTVVAVDGANEDEGLVLTWGSGVNKANAEFIAHARTDVPALLAEVERLREELANVDKPSPCVMTHTPPFDFAQCDTHDKTLALGEKCEWDGVTSIYDHLDDKVQVQRGLKIRAEMEMERTRAEVARLTAQQDAAIAYVQAAIESTKSDNSPVEKLSEDELAWLDGTIEAFERVLAHLTATPKEA